MHKLFGKTIYTIIYAASDIDKGCFHFSEARGSYLSLSAARKELARQIEEEKTELDGRYDCEEHDGDRWEMYQDGFAAAAYSRLEIVTTTLHLERSA